MSPEYCSIFSKLMKSSLLSKNVSRSPSLGLIDSPVWPHPKRGAVVLFARQPVRIVCWSLPASFHLIFSTTWVPCNVFSFMKSRICIRYFPLCHGRTFTLSFQKCRWFNCNKYPISISDKLQNWSILLDTHKGLKYLSISITFISHVRL